MDLVVTILIIVLAIWSRSAKNKKKSEGAKQLLSQNAARRQTGAKPAPAKPAAAKPESHSWTAEPTPARKAEPEIEQPLSFESFEQAERDGSIEMPAHEPHEHEGKPLPCPAEEREQPRPRPAQLAPKGQAAPRTALQLSFRQNNVLQAVVMSEILNRPRFENGRRVIR